MLRYLKEIVIFVIQLLIFYIFPLFVKQINPIGTVIFIILSVFVLSFLLGLISKEKIKSAYPIIISVLFIPSVYIYYNESALIHAVWYFAISTLGMVLGMILRKIIRKKLKKGKNK